MSALSTTNQDNFIKLNDLCKKYGIFIVYVGELESWLVPKGLPKMSNKSRWIVKALEKIPELEAKQEEEPWKFVSEIHEYIKE